MPKSNNWVDARRTAGREPGGENGNEDERDQGHPMNSEIGGLDSIEQSLYQAPNEPSQRLTVLLCGIRSLRRFSQLLTRVGGDLFFQQPLDD